MKIDDPSVSTVPSETPLSFSDALTVKAESYRQLYQTSGQREFLILANHTAEAAVEISEKMKNDDEYAPNYILAKIKDDMRSYAEAVEYYTNAIAKARKMRSAKVKENLLLKEMEFNLQTAVYKNGDETALEKAKDFLAEMELIETPSDYEKNAALTGGYLKMADTLSDQNPPAAHDYLVKAQDIIEKDRRLKTHEKVYRQIHQKIDRKLSHAI